MLPVKSDGRADGIWSEAAVGLSGVAWMVENVRMVEVLTKLQAVEVAYRSLVLGSGKWIDPVDLVRNFLDQDSLEKAVGELYQLEFFCKHLNDVRCARQDVFNELTRRMQQCSQPDNYYGLRMETRIASSLVRKELVFELRERPDFSIDGDSLFIECGSVWPDTSDPAKDYRARVASAIEAKNRKRYATYKTILALENTSVIAAMVDQGKLEDDTDFHAFLSHLANKMDFGSVLLFSTVYSHRTFQISSTYARIDSPSIDKTLLAFLDRFFPRLDIRVDLPFVPGQARQLQLS